MLERGGVLNGKEVEVCAYVVANRHGMVLMDAPDSQEGMPMEISDAISSRRDVRDLLDLSRQTWLGKRMRIQGFFKGVIRSNSTGLFFELKEVRYVTGGDEN